MEAPHCPCGSYPIKVEVKAEIPAIPQAQVAIGKLDIPLYFVGVIPANLKSVYDVLGIKFVQILNAEGANYYVLSTHVASVIADLKLYA